RRVLFRSYTELDNIESEEKLLEFKTNLMDRFGDLPPQVEELFNGIRLRWLAKKLGFERIIFKNGNLRCFFLENPESYFYETSVFGKLMTYVQNNPKKCRVKQTDKSLIITFDNIHKMHEAFHLLKDMEGFVRGKEVA